MSVGSDPSGTTRGRADAGASPSSRSSSRSLGALAPSPRARLRVAVGGVVVLLLIALGGSVIAAVVAPRGTTVGVGASVSDPASAAREVSGASPDGAALGGIDESLGEVLDGIVVHVLGAVTRPGLYRLPDGARVVDAVAAAGGFAPDAERGGLNLARVAGDAEQIIVPVIGTEPSLGPAGIDARGRVNLNTADRTALETLPRVGPAMAERIMAWREAHGGFATVDYLGRVSGIGPRTLDALRELVTV